MMIEKRLKLEGDAFSKMVQAMRKIGRNETSTVTLGTIIASPPEIMMMLDNDPIEYDKYDIYVAERLTRHERIVTITHNEMAERDLGDMVVNDLLHDDDMEAPFTMYQDNYVLMQFEDVLKVGDRVLVECDDENMKYIILDRVVSYA